MAKEKLLSDLNRAYSPLLFSEQSDVVPNNPKGPDRRKSRRIKDPLLIFLYRDPSGTKQAKPLDIGQDGIGIETKRPLNVDEDLQIAIIIGECQVNALGTVVYTRREKPGRFRSGIRFKEISERNKGIIGLYLEKTEQMER